MTTSMDGDGSDRGPVEDSSDQPLSLIEKLINVTALGSHGCTVFTNAAPLWHPPDAKGIYGGICIAQSINAGQGTVPPDFFVHSMHGQFVLAGTSEERLVYHIGIVNDGRNFATRTVQATQSGRTIFTAILNFATDPNSRRKQISHGEPMPEGIPEPLELAKIGAGLVEKEITMPYLTKKVGIVNMDSEDVHEKRVHQWSRASHRISRRGGVHAHLAALAYICDNYFVGTVPHVHKLWDFVKPPLTEFDVGGPDLSTSSSRHCRVPASDEGTHRVDDGALRIGMMVTLNHTMFFHAPREVRADEWMLSELSSNWSGKGRGIATQKIWTKEGVLVATCVQEGVVRLAENTDPASVRSKSRL